MIAKVARVCALVLLCSLYINQILLIKLQKEMISVMSQHAERSSRDIKLSNEHWTKIEKNIEEKIKFLNDQMRSVRIVHQNKNNSNNVKRFKLS